MPRLKPRDYQIIGASWLARGKRGILADDVGLGKSLQVLLAVVYQKQERVLIVVPNHLKVNWRIEIAKWLPRAPVVIAEGTEEEKLAAINGYEKGFLIINIESIREREIQRPKARGTGTVKDIPAILKTLEKGKFGVLVLDEAHRYINRDSQQTKGAKRLSRTSEYLFLLTATPIKKRVTDLYSLLHMVNPLRFRSFWTFAKNHAGARPPDPEFGETRWVVQDDSPDPDKLDREIAPYFLRRTKEDHLDLPSVQHIDLWVNLEGEHARIYKKMEKDSITQLLDGSQLRASSVLSLIMRLKQLAISPFVVLDDPELAARESYAARFAYTEAKMKALLNLIQSTPPETKFVIFSQFERVVSYIEGMCHDNEIGFRRYTGSSIDTSAAMGRKGMKRRDVNEEHWKTRPDIQVMGATMAAASEGLNWIEASYVVGMDQPWTPGEWKQAWGRVHRSGQEKPVTVYQIKSANTIEGWIEDKLVWREKVIEQVIGLVEERSRISGNS